MHPGDHVLPRRQSGSPKKRTPDTATALIHQYNHHGSFVLRPPVPNSIVSYAHTYLRLLNPLAAQLPQRTYHFILDSTPSLDTYTPFLSPHPRALQFALDMRDLFLPAAVAVIATFLATPASADEHGSGGSVADFGGDWATYHMSGMRPPRPLQQESDLETPACTNYRPKCTR